MKRFFSGLLACALVSATAFGANNASDDASEVVYNDGWATGDNGGTGFSEWTITTGGGGFAGTFIGDPAGAGISGMDTESFGMFANPAGSGALVTADRELTGGGLSVGQTFQFEWGANFDSGGAGEKGFRLYVGGVAGTEVVEVTMAGTSTITLNGNDVGFTYGTNVMVWSFTMTDPSTLNVTANDRDGNGTFSTNITVTAGIDAFQLYATELDNSSFTDQRQPYFNNFEVVPEPSTIALGILGVAALAVRRFRKA